MSRVNCFTEDDIRTKVVYTWLAGHGFNPQDIFLEHTVKIRLGRALLELESGKASKIPRVLTSSKPRSNLSVLRGRSDILVRNSQGKNLFILEIKAPGEPLDNDARDQGVSYARLLSDGNIPPFTILTNGSETKIFDSLNKEQIDGQQIPLNHPHVISGFQITGDDLRLRQEALEKLISLSPENLMHFCSEQSQYRMSRLRSEDINSGKKYIPSLYVERGRVKKMLTDFLDRERKPVVILTGPPQVGKTNFLCHFVEERISQGYPSLFYPAVSMQRGLLQEICDDFEWTLGDYNACSRFVHNKLRQVLSKSKKNLTFFIDGWNETSLEFARLIDKDVERVACSEIQIVVSFTNTAADRLLLDQAGNPSCIGDLASINVDGVGLIKSDPELMKSGRALNVVPIGKYDNDEMIQAYQNYSATYSVSVPSNHLKVCEPYLLGVAMKLFQNKRLPEMLEEPELLGRFIEYKIGRAIGLDEYNPRSLLVRLAEEMFTNGRPVSVEKALKKWELPIVTKVPIGLVDAAILIELLDADQFQSIDFYYDRERDFIVTYWAFNWLAKIDKGVNAESIFFDALRTSVGSEALGWFIRQAKHLPLLLSKEGRLPLYSDPRLRRIFIESLCYIAAQGDRHDSKKWLDYAKLVFSTDDEPLVKIEAVKLVALLSEDEEDLVAAFPDDAQLEAFVLGVLSINDKYPFYKESVGEVVLKSMAKLHGNEYFYNLADNLSESGISKTLKKIINDERYTGTIHSAALSCLAYSAPELYLKMLSEKQAVLARESFDSFCYEYLPGLSIAVSQIEEVFWPEGCWGCPDVEDEAELFSKEEYESWTALIFPVIKFFPNCDVSKRLREVLDYIASDIKNDEELRERALLRTCGCHGKQLTIAEEIQKIKGEAPKGEN
jgi:hypothetical protein